MTHPDARTILERLLTVTTSCRDAFAEAAVAMDAPRLTNLFIRRAEHQQRIADPLAQYLLAGGTIPPSSAAPSPVPNRSPAPARAIASAVAFPSRA